MMLKMYPTPDVPHGVCGGSRGVWRCVWAGTAPQDLGCSRDRLCSHLARSEHLRDLLGVSSIPGDAVTLTHELFAQM